MYHRLHFHSEHITMELAIWYNILDQIVAFRQATDTRFKALVLLANSEAVNIVSIAPIVILSNDSTDAGTKRCCPW